MKNKLLILMVLAMVGFLNTGCCCGPHAVFVKAVDQDARLILPQYKAYVGGDPTLNDDSKRIRIQTADELQKLIDEAKKGN